MEAIADAARRYAGVRFRHQGRHALGRQAGLDCLGLLMQVAQDIGLCSRVPPHIPLTELDRPDYGLIPDGTALRRALDTHLEPVAAPGKAGDIVLMRLDGNPQHLGIRSTLSGGREGLIHAFRQAGRVVEHQFASPWTEAVVAAYRINPAWGPG